MNDRARIDHHERLAGKLYSDFHYAIGRLLVGNHQKARDVGWPFAMIDVDTLEWCRYCHKDVAVFEIKHASEANKIWTKTWRLGKKAGIPAHLVVVHPTDDNTDIRAFQVYNGNDNGPVWKPVPDEITPEEFAVWLMNLHRQHAGTCPSMSGIIGMVDSIRNALRKVA